MGERCQNFGLKSVQLKKNGVEFGTTFIFIPVVYRQKYIYYSFASSEIPGIFSTDFYFILNKVAPICLVKEFFIFRAALQNDWMIRNDDDWFCLFFFTRRGALPLFRVPPHCSLNVFVRMALPTINTPLPSHNSQILEHSVFRKREAVSFCP